MSQDEHMPDVVMAAEQEADFQSLVGAIIQSEEQGLEASLPAIREALRQDTAALVAAAVYSCAKLAYTRSPTPSKHLSDLVSFLLREQVLTVRALVNVLDHESRVVVQPEIPHPTTPNLNDAIEGRDRVSAILHTAALQTSTEFSKSDVASITATAITSTSNLYKLDLGGVIQDVLNMVSLHIPLPPTESKDLPGGDAGCDIKDPYALAPNAFGLPPFATATLAALHPAAVKAASLMKLSNLRSEKQFRRAVSLAHALVCAKRIDPNEAIENVQDHPALKSAWEAYTSRAQELAECGGEIKNILDIVQREPRNGTWVVEASKRDVNRLEDFLGNGPWHCTHQSEIELALLALREARWNLAKQYLDRIPKDMDVATHPPIAQTLINLSRALLSRALHAVDPSLYPNGARRGEVIDELGGPDKGYPKTVANKEELFDPENEHGKTVREILIKLGPHARRSVPLVMSICRLLEDADLSKSKPAYELMQEVVLPSLSLAPSNFPLSIAIWKILCKCDVATRWALYEHQRSVVPKKVPAIAVANSRARYEARSVAKRITAENQHEETFAKISASHALVVGEFLFRRVQSFPADRSVISPFAECLVNSTELAFDMWTYIILDILGDEKRTKIKSDGTNFEQWFSSTSLFIGIFMRKAKLSETTMNSIVMFLREKIVDKKDSTYVKLLSDIVLNVTNIDVPRSMTTRQQKARAGGKHLRMAVQGYLENVTVTSALGSAFNFREEREFRRASEAFRKSLLVSSRDFSLACGLAALASGKPDDPDQLSSGKLFCALRDRLRENLAQFVEVLCLFAKKSSDSFWKPFKDMSFSELKEKRIDPLVWSLVMRPIITYPEDIYYVKEWVNQQSEETGYTPELAKAFWALNLADIDVPKDLYNAECRRLKDCQDSWEDQMRTKRMTRGEEGKYLDEKRRFRYAVEDMEDELKSLNQRSEKVTEEVKKVATQLAPPKGDVEQSHEVIQKAMNNFAALYFVPRALMTAADAKYCVRFVFEIIALNPLALYLPDIFRNVIDSSKDILENATEKEAQNFGVLVHEFLAKMDTWRSDKRKFDDDLHHGFTEPTQGRPRWKHEVFCTYAFDIHEMLTDRIATVLKSNDYMHVRNGLSLLHSVANVFPKVKNHGTQLHDIVKPLAQTSNKKDLKLAATRVMTTIEANEKKRIPIFMFKLKVKSGNKTPTKSDETTKKMEVKIDQSVENTKISPKLVLADAKHEPVPMETRNDPATRRTLDDTEANPRETKRGRFHDVSKKSAEPKEQETLDASKKEDRNRAASRGDSERNDRERNNSRDSKDRADNSAVRRDVEDRGNTRSGNRRDDRDGNKRDDRNRSESREMLPDTTSSMQRQPSRTNRFDSPRQSRHAPTAGELRREYAVDNRSRCDNPVQHRLGSRDNLRSGPERGREDQGRRHDRDRDRDRDRNEPIQDHHRSGREREENQDRRRSGPQDRRRQREEQYQQGRNVRPRIENRDSRSRSPEPSSRDRRVRDSSPNMPRSQRRGDRSPIRERSPRGQRGNRPSSSLDERGSIADRLGDSQNHRNSGMGDAAPEHRDRFERYNSNERRHPDNYDSREHDRDYGDNRRSMESDRRRRGGGNHNNNPRRHRRNIPRARR